MSMRTEQTKHTKLTSPDLRLRTSTALWGPLLITFTNHCEGAELGFAAGQAAYQEAGDYAISEAMQLYLSMPRHRLRICTPKIIAEWQAMFLLGWTSVLASELSNTQDEGEN